jgi:hypothetical protein
LGTGPQAPYEDLGRPTVRAAGETRGYTFDFTFRSKDDGGIYMVEMKCWLEYANYRYLTLESLSQLDRAGREQKAFRVFLNAALDMSRYTVTVQGRPQAVNGAVLIWGRCAEPGRTHVMAQYGFKDVLSLEGIVSDLVRWQNQDYARLIHTYEVWCGELFAGLRSLNTNHR